MKTILITVSLIIFLCFTCADKQTPDWTGTTQGEREQDSINDYMRHWYEVCDTNSDGDIDSTETH